MKKFKTKKEYAKALNDLGVVFAKYESGANKGLPIMSMNDLHDFYADAVKKSKAKPGSKKSEKPKKEKEVADLKENQELNAEKVSVEKEPVKANIKKRKRKFNPMTFRKG